MLGIGSVTLRSKFYHLDRRYLIITVNFTKHLYVDPVDLEIKTLNRPNRNHSSSLDNTTYNLHETAMGLPKNSAHMFALKRCMIKR